MAEHPGQRQDVHTGRHREARRRVAEIVRSDVLNLRSLHCPPEPAVRGLRPGQVLPIGGEDEIPEGLLPQRPTAESQSTNRVLAEYNAYLAELAENDKRTTP